MAFFTAGAACAIGAGILFALAADDAHQPNHDAYFYTGVASAGVAGALTIAGVPLLATSFFLERKVRVSVGPSMALRGAELSLTF
jgi:hypothetical protein